MKVKFPLFEVESINRLPERHDVLDAVKQKAAWDIQAEEDARIFEALDAIANTCRNKKHPGYGKPMRECESPECVAATVHDE